jgi:glycine betaine/choline ABC-type transport system substrate-binding protein
MIGPENVQISIRKSVLRRGYGTALRRRLNAATRVLSTLQLRGLNQQVSDGRLPEAVGAEFAESHGLVRHRRTRAGRRIVIGHFDFDETTVLAFVFAEALRGDGFRVAVRSVGGLRPQASKELRTGRIDMYQGYLTSGLKFLRPNADVSRNELSQLRSALAKLGATSLTPAPAEDKNVFVMKGDRARELGISKISDLARYWPASG